MTLEGRTAVVTGASRGIGFAIAADLTSRGARVVLTARHEASLAEAVERLGGPNQAVGVAGHAADIGHQRAALSRAISEFGSVDFLVNNAGINPVYGPLIELDHAAARKIFEVNCLAALSWTQEAYRTWMRVHGGAVVNIASFAGTKPAPGIGFYGASKAMLAHLTQELALELAPAIRVNAVAPAVIRTGFAARLYEAREDEVSAAYPLMRLGDPTDVSAAAAFLLSDEAQWITGQVVVIDGGLSLTGGV